MHNYRYVPRSEYNDHYSGKFHIALHLDQLVYRHPVLEKNNRLFGTLILLLNVLILFLMWKGYAVDLYNYIRASTTPSTTAVVTNVEPKVYYEAQSKAYEGVKFYHYDIQYEYTVDGSTYTAYIYDYWKQYETGDTLTIHYDPNKPSDNFFIKKDPMSEYDEYYQSKYPKGYTRTRRSFSGFLQLVLIATAVIIVFTVYLVRYTIWGRFQTEKNYIKNYTKLPKPKPHRPDPDESKEPETFDFYTGEEYQEDQWNISDE